MHGPEHLEYSRAYRYVFDSPNWGMNLLIGSLCQLVPIAGPIVLMGYLSEMIESFSRTGQRTVSDFDMNRLAPYFTRGAWPFLAMLIVSVATSPLYVVLFLPIWFGGALGSESVALAGFVIALVLILAASLLLDLIMLPIILRAALMQDLGAAFSWSFIKDFTGRVWREILLKQIFLLVSSLAVLFGGMILFCVGVYPAATLVIYAQWHLMHQTYGIYLERGGTPIPLKEPPPEQPIPAEVL